MTLFIGVRLVDPSHATCEFPQSYLRYLVIYGASKARTDTTISQEARDGYVYLLDGILNNTRIVDKVLLVAAVHHTCLTFI